MKCKVFIKSILLIIFTFVFISNLSAQNSTSFTDTADFKLYVNQTDIGDGKTWLDSNGHYFRKMKISMAGQSITFEMEMRFDEQGSWTKMEYKNPTVGEFTVKNKNGTAKYEIRGKKMSAEIPSEAILYDDYGTLFESLMLQKYDMEKRSKQTFKRFRISEIPQLPQNVIDVELEYLEDETKQINGKNWTFHVFNWKTFGINAKYWIDEKFKIYKIDSPTEYAVSIREGFEELLDFKVQTTQLKDLKKTVQIPLRDGIKLSTDLYFPENKESKHPIVLIRTPYKKEMQEIEGLFWAKNGYICAIQDVRGRFASEGEWEPFVNEAKDGYDVIEWLAKQEWSTGKIGMIGASYLGWVQLQAAVEKPPNLVTIIPNVAPPDAFYNIPYEYGSFFMLASLWWAQAVETEATADLTGKTLMQINEIKYEKILDHLPVIDIDKKIFGKENSCWRNWIKHNSNDSYWENANYLEKLKDLDIPVFLQSGWFDGDGIGSKLAYLELKKSKNKNIKLILGPWGHQDKASTQYYGKELGEEAGIDLQAIYLKWFDYWLKGIENKIKEEPLVELFTINSKKWLKADTYPLPNTKFTKFYINSQKGANTLKGDGKLIKGQSPIGKKYDAYTYNPGDPTPSWMFRFTKNGKKSYNEISNKRKDILVYETNVFEKPLTIAGSVSFKLYASSSAKDTDWFVTFQAINDKDEVIPLGNPWGRGTIRARFRNSTHQPEFLEKDKVYEYNIDLWHTGITFEKGWKIRLEITSAFFPHFSRNLNTGGHNEMETKYVKAKQNIYHSEEYPSHLLLPVVNLDDFKEIAADEDIQYSYVGEYLVRPGFVVTITQEGEKLMAEATGQEKSELIKQSETTYLIPDINAPITFISNKEGIIEYFILVQNGMKIQARNLAIPKQEPPNERKAIEIDPIIYNSYIGDYQLAPNAIINVTSENDKLFVQLSNQPKFEVYPESETDFFYTVVDAQISCIKNENGETTHIVLHQNGMDMQADRIK